MLEPVTDAVFYLEHHLPPFALEIVRLFIWLVLLTVIFVPIERLWATRRQKIVRKGFWADLAYYFLNNLLPAVILAVPLSLVAWAAYHVMPWRLRTLAAGLPLWANLAAVFLVVQVGAYWGHRWSHEIPLLWRFHAIHHSAEALDWLVNTRAHPLDMVFTRLCGLAPLVVLGLAQPRGDAGAVGPAVIVLVGTVWGFFIHANLRWRFGWLEWLVASPAFHHWHHTNDAMRDRNYAAMLPWLDRLFGTYHMPRKAWPAQYGTDTPVSGHLAGQLFQPLIGDLATPPKEAARHTG